MAGEGIVSDGRWLDGGEGEGINDRAYGNSNAADAGLAVIPSTSTAIQGDEGRNPRPCYQFCVAQILRLFLSDALGGTTAARFCLGDGRLYGDAESERVEDRGEARQGGVPGS